MALKVRINAHIFVEIRIKYVYAKNTHRGEKNNIFEILIFPENLPPCSIHLKKGCLPIEGLALLVVGEEEPRAVVWGPVGPGVPRLNTSSKVPKDRQL